MTSVTSERRRGLNASTAIKSPVIAASTADITLSAEQTIDGVALITGDRVLCKDQSTSSENGIYLVDTSTWQREPDWDGTGDVVEGTMVPVSRGATNALTWWIVANTGTIAIGSTDVTFTQGLTDVAIAATSTVTDESSDTTCFLLYVTDATGNLALKSGTNLTFNSNTGEFGATILASTVATGTAPAVIASTTEVANLNAEQHGGLKIKVIDIGDWNMDADATVAVAHGLTLANIRGASAMIRRDDNAGYFDFAATTNTIASAQRAITLDGTNITLSRQGGGFFDGVDYNLTSYNRGWITVHYV